MQTFRWKALVVLAGLIGCAAAGRLSWAADTVPPPPSDASSAAPATAVRDPVTTAFALPRGVKLSSGQQTAYDQLKSEREPLLRQALDKVHRTQGEAMVKAAREVRDQRAEIRAKIDEILSVPYERAGRASRESSGSPEGSGYSGSAQPYAPGGMPYYYPYVPYGAPYVVSRYPYYSGYPYPAHTDSKKTPAGTTSKPQNTVKPAPTIKPATPIRPRPTTTTSPKR